MEASRISAVKFRKVAAENDAIRGRCILYNEVLLSHARVTAACNALHAIECTVLPMATAIG
jgi:hypothetical protein